MPEVARETSGNRDLIARLVRSPDRDGDVREDGTRDVADGEGAGVEIDRKALGERSPRARSGNSQHGETVGLRDHGRYAVERGFEFVGEGRRPAFGDRQPTVRPDAEKRESGRRGAPETPRRR